MEKEQQYKLCNKCGKKNLTMFNFCAFCGNPLSDDENKKICSNCGKELEDDMQFCPNCGTKYSVQSKSEDDIVLEELNSNDNLEEIKSKEDSAESKKLISLKGVAENFANNKNRILTLFRNGIITIFCAIFFALSFLPIIKFDFGNIGGFGDDFSVELSTIDMIDLMVGASKSYSEDEIEDTKEYDFMQSLDEVALMKVLSSVLFDDDIDTELHDYLINYLKLELMSENNDGTNLEYQAIMIGVVSLLYIIFAFTIFLISLLNFILYLTNKKDLLTLTIGMVSSLLPISIMLIFACRSVQFSSTKLAAPMIAVLTLIAILIASIIIYSIVLNKKNIKKLIPQFITVGIILVILGSIFAPMYKVKIADLTVLKKDSIDTRITDVNIDIYADFFYEFKLSKEEIECYEIAYENQTYEDVLARKALFEQYSKFTKKDIENNIVDVYPITNGILLTEFVCGGGFKYSNIWAITVYLIVIVCCLLGGLMGISLSTMISGKKFVINMVAIQIVVIFMICLIMGLIISSNYIINYNLDVDEIYNCKILTGSGSIVMLIFAIIGTISSGIVSVFCKKKSQNEIE